MNKIDTTCEHSKIRLIAAAQAFQGCTRTDGTETRIPGTNKRILIGDDAYLAMVAAPAAKDGITSIEGLTRYEPALETAYGGVDVAVMSESIEGNYFDAADVERLLATQAQAAAPATDERALFEAAFSDYPNDRNMPDKTYNSPFLHVAWQGWQARAAIAHPASAVEPAVEQAEPAQTNAQLVKHGDVPSIEITLRQAKELVECFGGSDAEISHIERPAAWGDMPHGLYAYFSEYPDEGSMYLGPTEVLDEDDQAAPAAPEQVQAEPPRMSIDESREYLVQFMEQYFTDKTFHRYIRADRVDRNRLAGDFAWQMARALRMIVAAPSAAQVQTEPLTVKVERGRVWIVRGNQSFMLDYTADEGDDPAEIQAYADSLRAALSGFTPNVKITAPIAAAPAAPEQDEVRNQAQWISVDERLPEDGQVILILCRDAYSDEPGMWSAQWLAGSETFESKTNGWVHRDEVSYWMPLPAAPSMKTATNEGEARDADQA